MKNSIKSVDPELGFISKVVLDDIEDIIDAVHESFHYYMEDDLYEEDSDFSEFDNEEDDIILRK